MGMVRQGDTPWTPKTITKGDGYEYASRTKRETGSHLPFRLQSAWKINGRQCGAACRLSCRGTAALGADWPYPQLHAQDGSHSPPNTGTCRRPAWALDRARLWNAIDNMETRKDAQLGSEVEVALPLILSPTDNLELLRAWVRDTFVAAGHGRGHCVSRKKGQPPCPHPADAARHRARRIWQKESRLECPPAP